MLHLKMIMTQTPHTSCKSKEGKEQESNKYVQTLGIQTAEVDAVARSVWSTQPRIMAAGCSFPSGRSYPGTLCSWLVGGVTCNTHH